MSEQCTDNSCNELGTEMRYRGSEEIPYCRLHAAWWDKLMENCF